MWPLWLALAWNLCFVSRLNAATTALAFTLDEPCKTSAGVYQTNGTLVRTLWSKVRYYAAGTYSTNWDGLDDYGNPVPTNTVCQIKLLQHNTEYVWDGAIGNTSAHMSGPAVHTAFYTIHDMTISGTNAFYTTGYNEGKYDFVNFSTTDPQTVLSAWSDNPGTSDIFDRNWEYAASDSNWVYFAAPTSMNPTNSTVSNYKGFVIADKIGATSAATYTIATFTNGVGITNNNYYYANGIYVGTQPGLSGIAVQINNNLLAVSVAPDNAIYLLDKRSGATLGGFSVADPGRLSFSPDGSLWVVSSNNVIQFVNLTSSPSVATTISGFFQPLAVAVSPTNSNLILVADGGASQQIKAFNSAGSALWTYGMAGGYPTNGPAVTTNKFWFLDDLDYAGTSFIYVPVTFLCFAPDGSFWVGDGGNHRAMHFSSSANYLGQVMFQIHSYQTCVDQNNTNRVFNQFLEFNVDYTKPLPQAWTLVNNWRGNVGSNNLTWNEGLYEVTTFTNGRTYGLIFGALNQGYAQNYSELVELATNGLRFTGIFPLAASTNRWISLGADGSVRAVADDYATWYGATLAGFDTNNNPLWNPPTLLASAPNGSSNPVPRCCSFGNVRTTISSNNILISFDQTLNNGFHLGGVQLGGSNWLWQASPAVALNTGNGSYEISNSVAYGGNTLQAMDRNVIFGYHGEFFRGQGQAGQYMHFYDDGLFVGQFGECSIGHSAYEGAVPAFAGNGQCPSLIKTATGDYYVWINDESEHGPQRWHLVNARNIREQIGFGTPGSPVTLTNQSYDFPSAVTGVNGEQSCELSWQPVAGATFYRVYYSTNNGGPYSTYAGRAGGTHFTAGQLVNGKTYYFAVTAVVAGVEGTASEQVPAFPFDTNQTVLCAGSASESLANPLIDVSASAVASGAPSFLGTEFDAGVLNLRETDYYGYGNLADESVGTKGYVIYDWGGAGSNLVNLVAPFVVSNGSGWTASAYLSREYKVSNVVEADYSVNPVGIGTPSGLKDGIQANPSGTINISANGTNFHYLTVVSPAWYNLCKCFTMTLTSTNGTSASYSVNETYGAADIFQFLFKGNVTLTANSATSGGMNAIVGSLFFDDAPLGSFTPPATPTDFEPQGAPNQ